MREHQGFQVKTAEIMSELAAVLRKLDAAA